MTTIFDNPNKITRMFSRDTKTEYFRFETEILYPGNDLVDVYIYFNDKNIKITDLGNWTDYLSYFGINVEDFSITKRLKLTNWIKKMFQLELQGEIFKIIESNKYKDIEVQKEIYKYALIVGNASRDIIEKARKMKD